MALEENQMEELNSETIAQNQKNVANPKEQVSESVDYRNYSLEELISAMEGFCTKEMVEVHRKEIEDIRSLFYKKQKSEYDEAKNAFIDANGTSEGFIFESKENEFKDVYGRIKALRASLVELHKKEQAENLKIKLQIIEKLEKLTEAPESINKTFAEFRSLQEEWKNSGVVAPTEDKVIWEKYHLQVGKFYDYVKIDRELRDLDLKKNYEAKVALCEAAERLTQSKQIIKANADLQALHDEWRKIGPVKEELKEALWERFKTATTIINKAHQDYFANLKQQEEENLHKKTALCEKLEAINQNLDLSQKQWVSVGNQVLEIQKEWKLIGYAPQKQNNLVYERFMKACNDFFTARKSFYGEVHEVESDNKKQKIALCEKAEAMQSRTDWREATQDFVVLQKEWKKVGHSGFKDSQKLWNRFSTACNAFFDAKKAYEVKQDQDLQGNISVKESLITSLSEIKNDSKEEALKELVKIQEQWSKIPVPATAKADLQSCFTKAINDLLAKLNFEKGATDELLFKLKMSALILEANGKEKVIQEAKHLKNKLTTLQNEIKSLENNIGFFSKSTDASKLIASVEKNIEKNKKEASQLEQKLKVVDRLLKESK